MNAMRLTCHRHIGTIVYQNFRSVRIRNSQDLPGQFSQIANRQVPLPDLHEFDALCDAARQMRNPSSLVYRESSVRDQAANHGITHSATARIYEMALCFPFARAW